MENSINQDNPKEATGFKLIFRALRHHNFQLFFGGQSISLVGTWIQRIAMQWLVYRLTGSVFLLGIVGFTGELPVFLLSPVAGVLCDRYNRHRFLILTQTMAMIQALILAFLVMTGTIQVWHIIILSIFLGVINVFDMPVRQSLLIDMIEKRDDLGNAIALNSSMVNAARLIGPSIAGILIATVGEGLCFLINGISYIAVIVALFAMKLPHKAIKRQTNNILTELKEGFTYTFGFPPMRSILLLLAVVSLMGWPYQVLMPVFAKDILKSGPETLGFLMGATGLGALIGAVSLAARKKVQGLPKIIILAAGIFGSGLIIFSLSRIFIFSLFLMLIVGFGMMVQMASSNTVLQTIVADDKRGRVMSFYTMAFRGMTPFGSLFVGALADKIGAPNTLAISGTLCILGAILFARQISAVQIKDAA